MVGGVKMRQMSKRCWSSCCKAMGWKKIVESRKLREQYERNETREESMQSKAKAAADSVVQNQNGEMWEAGREGKVMTHKGSVQEMWRPWYQSGRRNQVEHAIEIWRRSGEEN